MTERETIEVDRDYLWALEVLALQQMYMSENPDDVENATRRVKGANLKQAREK